MHTHRSYTFDGFSSDSIRRGHEITLYNILVNRLLVVQSQIDETPRSVNPKLLDELQSQANSLVEKIFSNQEYINTLLVEAGHKIISHQQNELHIMAQFSNESNQLITLTKFNS